MTASRTGLIWPAVIVTGAVFWLLHALGLLPGAALDLVSRGWPAVLVAVGLMLLFGRRVRFGNLLSIILAAGITGGVVAAAFGQQSDKFITENEKAFNQPIDPQISTLKIVLNTLNTEVTIAPPEGPAPAITAAFTGSRDSEITSEYTVDGTTGTFTLVESQNASIPSLSGLGRGRLTVKLPASPAMTRVDLSVNGRNGTIRLENVSAPLVDVTLASAAGVIDPGTLPASVATLTITSAGPLELGRLPAAVDTLSLNVTGSVNFDGTGSSLRNMTVNATGPVEIRLPDRSGLIGDIKSGGSVTLSVPPTIAASIRLAGGAANNTLFNQADYILTIDQVLVSRRSNEPQMQIRIDTSGQVTIQ